MNDNTIIVNNVDNYLLSSTLQDVNDNSPTFDQASYEIVVAENTPGGTVLPLSLNAEDPDAGSNGQVAYYVDVNAVSVDNVTGDVMLLVSPDFEETNRVTVTVSA